MILLPLMMFVAHAGWRVDPASLAVRYGADVAAEPCTVDGVLGVAAVVYSRKQGTMAWGHTSLRTVVCEDGVQRDREYESYRFSPWNEDQLRHEHKAEGFLDDAVWMAQQRGALVLFRNDDPVRGGWYADAQAHNREIYEIWLDLPPNELAAVVGRAESAYETQLERMRARLPLQGQYRALSTNCTWILSVSLPEALTLDPPHLPFAWLRRLEPVASERVLHPSHHLVRRWRGELPTDTERLRPIFRRRARLEPELVESLIRGPARS